MRTMLTVIGLAALAFSAPVAQGAPCVMACRDEIRSCVTATCQGLKPAAKSRCRRRKCTRPIVNACYGDLTVCGATSARPAPPPTTPYYPMPGY